MESSFTYRFTAFNFLGGALLALAWGLGWVGVVWQADAYHVTSVIFGLFLLGLALSFVKAMGLDARATAVVASTRTFAEKELALVNHLSWIEHVAGVLLMLGICGTFVGLVMALKSTELLGAGNPAAAVTAIALLFKGVYVKFYCSLTGIILHLWTNFNHRMLEHRAMAHLAKEV